MVVVAELERCTTNRIKCRVKKKKPNTTVLKFTVEGREHFKR